MERIFKPTKTLILNKPKTSGKSLEEQIQDLLVNNEPIQADSPMIYNEAKEGVSPNCDIRTDKWEIALAASDNYARSVIAKSKEMNKDVTLNTERNEENNQNNNEKKAD